MVIRDAFVPDHPATRSADILQSQGGINILPGHRAIHLARKDDLPSVHACPRAHIHQKISRLDYVLVMFDHNHGVPYVTQALEHAYQPFRIPRMKSYARLVEYVHRTHEGTSERCHEVHPLALPSRKCVAGTAESKVRQADIVYAPESGDYLLHRLPRHMPFVITQLKITEESQKFTDGHRKQLMYVLPANFYIQGILAQTASPALLAAGLPGKPAQHILVLDLVLVGLDPPEEFIQTDQTRSLIPRVTAFPYQVPHFLRKLTVRGEYGNMVTFRH